MAVPIVVAAIAKLSEKTEKSDNSESKSSNIPEKIGSEADLSKAIPDKLDMSLENNTAELSSSIPDKLEGQPFYSTYEERKESCPKNSGEWSGIIGESKWVPNNEKYKSELAKYDKEGIDYKDAVPDFAPFAKDSVEIDDMKADMKYNFLQAYNKFAEKWRAEGFEGRNDWTPRLVKQYKQENGLDLHECSDMKTCQLVPHDIHMCGTHKGGRYECSIRDGERSKFDD